jgi:hypothetical protein
MRGILPLLRDYYNLQNFLLPERQHDHNVRIAEDIWDVLNVITKKGGALMGHMTCDERAELRSNAFSLMNNLVHNGGVRRECVSDDVQIQQESLNPKP